ncbi:MAG TPA: carbon-nitrogen family hydrolase [Thermoanaerobacterales bacterium]|nr:carbon-nitrogen family hydrolase [Thermoanaerobacterales bacterium]
MEQIKLKISLIQMDVAYKDPDANLNRAETMINKALKQRKKPNVLVLPEMWTSGGYQKESKIHDGSPAVNRLKEIAAKNSVNIVAGSVIESRGDKDVFNTAYIIDRQGNIIAAYDQVHRQRHEQHAQGSDAVTFDIDGICCGIILGYDLRFPEFVRQLALKGAKVLFVPGMWSGPREVHWKLLNIVRAIENQFFVVAVNGAGKTGDVSYPGMSMVVDPWGEILIEGDDAPDILTTVINIGLVDRARAQNPVLSDRRPDVYKD